MAIKNEAKNKDEDVRVGRGMMRHRAAWFYFLLDEARQRGLEWDDFARKAIYRVGQYHGENLYPTTDDLEEFARGFPPKLAMKILEAEVVESNQDRYVLEFHYCPLVAEWMELTDQEDDIAHLCDIAMDGDKGICSTFPAFNLEIPKKIADGDDVCRLEFTAGKQAG